MGGLLFVTIFSPLVAAIVVLLLGPRRPDAVRWVTLGSTLLTMCLILGVFAGFDRSYSSEQPSDSGPIRPQMQFKRQWHSFELSIPGAQGVSEASFEFSLGIDGISLWLVGLTGLLMISAVLVSWKSIQESVAGYHALLLFLETGMLGVFCAFDVILFYIFFEFTLVPLFFLIGKWGGPHKRFAAFKFFIYTMAGSVISLVGLIALVLALNSKDARTLTFSIPELAQGMQRQMRIAEGEEPMPNLQPGVDAEQQRLELRNYWHNTQWWIFLALFAGFAIKVPLAPFHTWLPLAHVEAPTAGSVLLAGVLLKLGSYGFLRLCLPLLPYACWNIGVPLIATLSVIGIVYGSLCALAQTDIKRLVAYSSVSHMGFAMLGLFALNAEGITGSVMQMINHGLSTGALFLLVGMLYERYHTRKVADFGGMASRLPLLTIFMVFICLSSVGLPGLNGFIGEVLALIGMFKMHPAYAVVGATGVILGAWYLFNLLEKVFFGPLKEPHVHGPHEPITDLNGRELAALIPIAVLCLGIGVYPKPLLETMRPDVEAIAAIYDNHTTPTPQPQVALTQAEER